MNRTPDVDLVLRDYFADDGLTAPDYILDVVEGRISRQSQRRTWPFPGRTNVTTQFKLIAGLAAVVLVAIVGYSVLPRQPGVGGPTTPIPSPTAARSVSPTEALAATRVVSLQPLPVSAPNLTIEVTLPAEWGDYDSWMLLGPQPVEAQTGEVKIAFTAAEGLHSDPCHWDRLGNGDPNQPGDLEVGPTVEDLASALAASDTYETTTPTDVTVGGFPGKALDLELPPSVSGCDVDGGAEPRRFVFSGAESRGFTVMGEASRSQVSIVDVNGARLIAVVMSYPGTSDADLTAAQAILDSLVITP